MQQIDIEKKVNGILLKMRPVENIDGIMSLRNDFGIDSLALVNLMVMLEEVFHITLEITDLNPDKLQEVNDLYMLIKKYVVIE